MVQEFGPTRIDIDALDTTHEWDDGVTDRR